jgi:hypothetical protein
MTGSPGGLSGSITSGSVTPALMRAFRTRSASSPAALLVNVRPRTCSGATCPVPTSHTTRAAITVVLPEPAPATITCGAGGAVMQAVCSGVNGMPRSSLSCSGSEIRAGTSERLAAPTDSRCPIDGRAGGCAGQHTWCRTSLRVRQEPSGRRSLRYGGCPHALQEPAHRHHHATDPLSPDHAPSGSLDHVPPLRPRAARGPERAVGAVLAGRRCEPFVEDLARRGGEEVADPLPSSGTWACTLGKVSPPSFLGAP